MKLNQTDSSIVYQKALNRDDIKFSVQAITGTDFNRIQSILSDLMVKGWTNILPDYHIKKYFGRTPEDIHDQIMALFRLSGKNQSRDKIILYYPETGMTLDDQRFVVKTALESILEFSGDISEVNLMIITNSPTIISDITEGNLTILLSDTSKNNKLHKASTLGANLYDIYCTIQEDGMCMGECGRGFITSYLDKSKRNEKLTSEERKAMNFIGDEFIRKQVERQF